MSKEKEVVFKYVDKAVVQIHIPQILYKKNVYTY
jgi:hypothetical protein